MISETAFDNLLLYLRKKNPDWRVGQVIFNAATIISGNYYAGIPVDPFYNNDLAPEFYNFLVKEGIVILE